MPAPRAPRARIADVAREAGVSKTAVSFAFNQPDRLAPQTAARIREVADHLGYRPHPVARMLSQRHTTMLGVLTPQALSVTFSNPFFGAFNEGVALAAEEAGYGLCFISPLHGSLALGMGRASVDGVVAIGLSDRHHEVEQIRRAGVPIVLVDSNALPEHGSVVVDDLGGAIAAAEHLLGLGHRDVAVFGVEPPVPGELGEDGVTARRLQGYRQAFAGAGLAIPDERVIMGPATVDGGIAALEAILEAPVTRPTAILAMSDAMAIGAISAARRHGLRVPDDLSVVGFDDIDLASHTDPPLTTVHQPIRQTGEEAVRLLRSVIERPDGTPPDQRRLDTRLLIRGSTGPVPNGRKEVPDPRH